ncbi:MFS general substrate transporter [Scleroderma citrinum]
MSLLPRSSTDRLLGDVGVYSDVDEPGTSTSTERRDQIEKSLLRKLDMRVFFLIFVYTLNSVDRYNIASARLQGLEEDLHMTGQQFNTLISTLYIGYVLMQIPSNIFLNELRKPSIYLSFCIFLWGIFSIWTGVATSFRTALLSRFFLGFVEATYYPGAAFILSRWYRPYELGLRMVYFISGSAASKIIGPPIASGIHATMDGILGCPAWRWLFFIEGLLTCVVAAMALKLIPDFPSTPASWLTTEEQILAQQRMMEDPCDVQNDPLKGAQRSGLVEALADWTVWCLAIAMTFLSAMSSFGDFFPTLVATMGYGPTISLLLCSPPWILGAVTSLFVMRHSDATRERFWHMTGPVLMAVIGFSISTFTIDTTVRYLSLFFMAQSSVSFAIAMTWLSNSIPESSSKRAVAIAFVSTFSGFGDTGGSYIWVASWGPSYSKSYLICIFAAMTTIMMLQVYRMHLIQLNKNAGMNERTLGLSAGFRYIT